MPSHYEILGVPRSASAAEIRKAYLGLARERHPDRFTDPAEKKTAHDFFADLTTAFNTLSNETNRKEYDQEVERPKLQTPSEIAADAHARGRAAFEEGQYDAAVTLLRTAVHHQPDEAKYHAALGQLLAKLKGQERAAVQCFEKAAQLAPQVAGYQLDMAVLFDRLGLSLRAQRAVETAQRIAPRDPQVRRIATQLGLS